MKEKYSKISTLFLFLWFFNIGGCATYEGNNYKDFDSEKELLSYLHKTISTKEEIVKIFGSPNATFIEEKVFTYKVIEDKKGKLAIPLSIYHWEFVSYSLVLVFGDDQTLMDYSLVSIK